MKVQRSLWCVVALLSMSCALAQGMSEKDEYFASLNAAMGEVKSQRAELLAPEHYGDAVEAIKDLEKYYSGKPRADRLQKERDEVQLEITKVQQLAALSQKTLSSIIKAYDDAVVAGAPKNQADAWKKAELRFMQAVAKVEGSDLDAARAKGAEAEVLLREVELLAIKTNVLAEVRSLIAQAQMNKVPDYAPRSFAVAQQQVALADQQLNRNRYDLGEPKRLSAQALYEVKHAQYLADLIQHALAKEGVKQQVAEEQWLALEPAVRELAAELTVAPVFEHGVVPVLHAARDRVLEQQQQLSALRSEVAERDQQIGQLKAVVSDLNTAITKLDSKLGSESQERLALLKRLSAQDRVRESINKIENMFTAEEGRVYRQANQLVMSINAISFRSGKSAIEASSYPVLDKVGQALKLFPNASISVEGHTDSMGSDSTNLLLSQDRADAVREYLISNLGVSVEKVSSVGYGESTPVANNETESGRARNRRIEIVMNFDEAT